MMIVIQPIYEGRHSQMSRRDVRSDMVRGAIDLLATHGVQGTSFALLIEATDAPRGSIYHHFPGGKSELIRDAVASIGASITSLIDGVTLSSPEDVVGTFIAGWRSLLTGGDFDRGCAVAATSLGAGDDTSLREAAHQVFHSWTHALTGAFVRAGVDRPEAAEYASLCIAVVEGALILGRAARSDEIFDVAQRQLTTLVGTPQTRSPLRAQRSTSRPRR
jgi:AcrR family transcriptional regulator